MVPLPSQDAIWSLAIRADCSPSCFVLKRLARVSQASLGSSISSRMLKAESAMWKDISIKADVLWTIQALFSLMSSGVILLLATGVGAMIAPVTTSHWLSVISMVRIWFFQVA